MRAKEGDAHASHSKFQKPNRPHGGLLQESRAVCTQKKGARWGALSCRLLTRITDDTWP
jgi:hypothetical protein